MTPTARRWAIAAVGLAVIGVVANVVRPLAPGLGGDVLAQELFGAETLQRVRDYRQPRLVAAVVAFALSVVVPITLVLAPRPRVWLTRLAERPGASSGARSAMTAGALVAGTVVLATRVLTGPLAFWVGHVHEVRWGFRTAGPWTWLRDWSVGLAAEVIVAAVGGAVFVLVWRRWPADWHWRLVVLGTALSALVVMLHPVLVQPLTLSTTPVPDGALRDELMDVVEAAGLPPVIEVGDASRRTTKVNAFVTGLGPTRRVVLWDTLLALPTPQVVAVVAHELAHREHRDLPRGVALGAVGLLPFALVLRRLLDRPDVLPVQARPEVRAVLVLAALGALGQAIAVPPAMWVSRRAEAAADHRALQLTDDPDPLVDAFRGFVARDLSWADPPLIAVVLFGSHPSPDRRIRAIVEQARRDGLPVAPTS